MDKVKEIWGFVKRQHFWILSPIIFLTGLVGWMMATSKLATSFDTNKTQVDGYISKMNTVRGVTRHPNQEYLDGMDQLIEQRRNNVKAAWEKKWEAQKQRLVWPAALDAEFRAKVEPMRPIESVGQDKDNALLPIQRRQYADFVKKELPRLAELIGAKWAPTGMTGGGAASGFRAEGFRAEGRSSEPRGESATLEEGDDSQVVTWSPANQGEFASRLIEPYEDTPPLTRLILYAQEDLWVLESIIDIIKKTNGDAMARSQAAVKEIRYIKIGKDVPPPRDQGFSVVRPTALAGEEGAPAEAAAAEPTGGDAAPAEPTGGDTSGAPAVDAEGRPLGPVDPVALFVKNRYYDAAYEPIADLETLKSTGMVAKRIPVRLMVLIDQRKLNQLLVEAANAPLTFEVRQLRFNPSSTPGSAMNGMFSGREAESPFGATTQAKVRTLQDYQSFDRWVELFGIIYIFNPVNEALLNGEQPLTTEVAPPAA